MILSRDEWERAWSHADYATMRKHEYAVQQSLDRVGITAAELLVSLPKEIRMSKEARALAQALESLGIGSGLV